MNKRIRKCNRAFRAANITARETGVASQRSGKWYQPRNGWWLILLFTVGCRTAWLDSDPSPIGTPNPRASGGEPQVTLHRAGSVLAGTVVQHTFPFQNRTPGTLRLASPNDVRPSCGCATARVVSQQLAPGETTPIVVRVETENRGGRFSEVVATTWTTEDQQRVEYAFAIQGEVDRGLILTPPELSFAKRELGRNHEKRVQCSSDLSIDWESAIVYAEADYLRISLPQPLPDGQGIAFCVTCNASGIGGSRQDTVLITADGSLPDDPDPRPFSIRLPVYSTDAAPLTIAPRIATLRRGKVGSPWTGLLIVTGDAITAGADVQHVSSPIGKVAYDASRIAPGTLRIDLDCWPNDSLAKVRTQPISIEFTTGERRQTNLRLLDTSRERTEP